MLDILDELFDEGPDETDLTPEEGLKRRDAKDEEGEGEKRNGEEDTKFPPATFFRGFKCAYLFLAESAAAAEAVWAFLAAAATEPEDFSKRNSVH